MLEEYRIGRLKGGQAAAVADPYAHEPQRLPALIVRSQKPMNAGERPRGSRACTAQNASRCGKQSALPTVASVPCSTTSHHPLHFAACAGHICHAHAPNCRQPTPIPTLATFQRPCVPRRLCGRDAQGAAGGFAGHPQRALLRAQPPARTARGRRHVPPARGGRGPAHGERAPQPCRLGVPLAAEVARLGCRHARVSRPLPPMPFCLLSPPCPPRPSCPASPHLHTFPSSSVPTSLPPPPGP